MPYLLKRALANTACGCALVESRAWNHVTIWKHDTMSTAGTAEEREVSDMRLPIAEEAEFIGNGYGKVSSLQGDKAQQAFDLFP
jgi:hypothetical protein